MGSEYSRLYYFDLAKSYSSYSNNCPKPAIKTVHLGVDDVLIKGSFGKLRTGVCTLFTLTRFSIAFEYIFVFWTWSLYKFKPLVNPVFKDLIIVVSVKRLPYIIELKTKKLTRER